MRGLLLRQNLAPFECRLSPAQLALQFFQLALHLFAQLQVQRAQGFIQQQHIGRNRQRPRQRHPLPLPARKRMRRPLPVGVPVAASCHTVEDLRSAQDLGCDFVVVGSLKPTPSHPGEPGIGWDAFARLRETVSLPMYAIGGLGSADLPEARRHGAQGIAAIRAWWG